MKKNSVAEEIVKVLQENGIDHVFGITGAGNLSLFDALAKVKDFKIIFTHHEQAAVMAANTFYRTSGKMPVVVLTTGAGASNAITGVLGANMDSVPLLILAGTEPIRFISSHSKLRGYGVQGFDTVSTMMPVVKFAKRVEEPGSAANLVREAINVARSGRNGVSWIEISLDIQSKEFPPTRIEPLYNQNHQIELKQVAKIYEALQVAERPLLWIGNGLRDFDNREQLADQLLQIGIPFFLTWAAADLVSHENSLYVGKAGLYGERSSNLLLQSCDYLLAIGTRLAVPQIGYSLEELAPQARVDVIDIDPNEIEKLGQRVTLGVCAEAKEFVTALSKFDYSERNVAQKIWKERARSIREKFPILLTEHTNGQWIHSNEFMIELSNHLNDDDVLVTDAGTAFISTHYGLRLNGKQRLMASTGLGEMGFGLPGAIGAAIASGKKRAICMNSDGGLMMNLQELQTAVHHQLDLKIFIFNNDGYLSIKNSQRNLFEDHYVGVDPSSGLSIPDYEKVARAFGLGYFRLDSMSDFENVIPSFLKSDKMSMCEIFIDPHQPFEPRVSTQRDKDGGLISPPLEDMVPLIALEDLELALQRAAHNNSIKLRQK